MSIVKLPVTFLTVAELVDALGVASAAESDAIKRRKQLRDALEAYGNGAYDGTMYRATVTTNAVNRISSDLVRELLSPEDVALVTVTTDETRVRCTARNGKR